MRDRMIIFRDQYDLDDCLRLLVNEAVFHGGDPSQAINWELPTIFFEKYWFLTTNYTLERTSQKWRELKKMVASEAPQTSNSNLSPSTSTLDNLNSQNPKNNNNNNNNNSMNENSSMEIGQELGQQQQVYYNTSQPSSTAHKSPLHTMAPFEGNNDGPVIQGSMNNSNKKGGTNNVNSSVYGVPQAIHNMANVHGTFDNNINKTPGNPASSLSQPSRSPSSSNYTDINQQQIGAESQNTNSLQYSSDYPMPAQRFMQMSLPTGIDHLQQQMQQIQQPQQNQQQNQQQNWNQLYYFGE
ncbi:hypothetical protein BJ944DRAFT_53593 [Cunninghamella echinulata]|nr:hypothetical protein BJ944DRAFT_53593 [Cunninghamella echinulata]